MNRAKQTLLLATTSAGKLLEMRALLEGLPVEVVSLGDFPDAQPPTEPGADFRDNAAVKALYYEGVAGVPAVGEDSGLVVDALGGEPGIHSARWLGAETDYRVKNQALLDRLVGIPDERRTARYTSAVAMAREGRIVFACEESCEGRIAPAAKGEGGFGYDPVFFYPPYGLTLAEVTADQKNAVSHRGKAMKRLAAYVRKALVDANP